MGSRAKKIKKNIIGAKAQKNKESIAVMEQQQIVETRQKIAEFKSQQKYDDALSVIIAMFDDGKTSPEFLYETADIYYMAGDYERAAVWANKTLTFEPNHLLARLLLAKLYAMQDKQKDCFSMMETLLKGHNEIPADVCSEIDDLLLYFQDDYEESELENRYPLLFAYLHSAEGSEETAVNDEEVLIENPSIGEEDTEVTVQESAKPMDLQERNAEDVIRAIMSQPVSLIEKLDACIKQAMDYYISGDLVKSLMLLKQALLIDGTNGLALKNTAMVLIDMGEKAGALEVLSKIKEKDFMVLNQMGALSQ